MPRPNAKVEEEHDRMEILRYLHECGFMPITPRSILLYLDDMRHELSAQKIEFHLYYLCDRRWVDLGIKKIIGQGDQIQWVRITANGVDEFNRRAMELGEIR